jgi:hypothetical protein
LNIAVLGMGSDALVRLLPQLWLDAQAPLPEISVSDQTCWAVARLGNGPSDPTLLQGYIHQHRHTFSATLLLEDSLQTPDHSLPFKTAQLRIFLDQSGIEYSILQGTQQQREAKALEIIQHHATQLKPLKKHPLSEWCWSCEKCSDSGCERLLFSQLVAAKNLVGA